MASAPGAGARPKVGKGGVAFHRLPPPLPGPQPTHTDTGTARLEAGSTNQANHQSVGCLSATGWAGGHALNRLGRSSGSFPSSAGSRLGRSLQGRSQGERHISSSECMHADGPTYTERPRHPRHPFVSSSPLRTFRLLTSPQPSLFLRLDLPRPSFLLRRGPRWCEHCAQPPCILS